MNVPPFSVDHNPEVAKPGAGPAGLEQRAFLSNLRHELRTPINAITGYSEMLLEDTGGEGDCLPNLQPDLERILSTSRILLERVNDLLDPSKVEAGQFDANLEMVGVNLRHELRTPINTIIGYCEMLLEDLAVIEDNGFAADIQKIHTAAHSFLTLIEQVVQYAQTPLANLPAEIDGLEASLMIAGIATTMREMEEAEPVSSGMRGLVLVVDDNAINRDVLSRRVEREGLQVEVAENGRTALQMLRARRFDLVLLDILMPELNGYLVLQEMKSDPGLREIPVIMISALDEIDSVVLCIEMGAEDYLPKPFSPILLRARIGACLEKKHLRDKEVEYLRQAALVTAAAAAVEANRFNPHTLDEVAARPDELGQLARVFQRMATEVYKREESLREQVRELRIQIDERTKQREVEEIVETDYFQELQRKAARLRKRQEDS